MSTWTPISTQTLSANTTTVTFSGIPQTYTDLVLVCNARSARTADNFNTITVQVNGLTTSIYSYTTLSGDGSAVQSTRESNQTSISPVRLSTSASSFTSLDASIIHFMNYSNTTTNKTVLGRGSSMGEFYEVITTANLIRTTNAITSITLSTALAGDFVSGSTFTLYGIGAGSPKAFGGDRVVTDGTYWYHAFTSSGRFEPVQNLSCDVLVVAGGGGASALSGGGGAGGLLIHSSQSLSVQNYTVTVGAGGTATDNRNATGGNGANSQFGTLTASVGGGGGGGDQNAGTTLPGANGGSGGGGGRANVGGTGTSGQGSNGGNGIATANFGGGGGGGAGAVGANAVSNNGGNGGIGFFNSVTNAMGLATSTGELSSGNYYYAGGGGGGSNNGVNSTGGLGGGGNSTSSTNAQATVGIAGDANTGGGGGGNNSVGTGQFGGNGGSGIVIVRYLV